MTIEQKTHTRSGISKFVFLCGVAALSKVVANFLWELGVWAWVVNLWAMFVDLLDSTPQPLWLDIAALLGLLWLTVGSCMVWAVCGRQDHDQREQSKPKEKAKRSGPKDRREKVGHLVKNLRLRKGWAVAALADRAQVRTSHIINIEHGVATLTDPVTGKLAAALGVMPEYLTRPMMLDSHDCNDKWSNVTEYSQYGGFENTGAHNHD